VEQTAALARAVDGQADLVRRAGVAHGTLEQRLQMLLGIFISHGVLPLEFKPSYSLGDLLLQHLDALEQEAEEKGDIQQVLADHFAKVYKVAMPFKRAA
jgi:hypothetical protein